MPGCDHHLTHTVDPTQSIFVYLEYTVTVRNQFDLAFLNARWMHMLSLTDFFQDQSRLILVQHAFFLFPDIQIFLAHRQKYRNILLRHDMAFPEYRILCYSPDDLCDIMADHMTYRIFCSD